MFTTIHNFYYTLKLYSLYSFLQNSSPHLVTMRWTHWLTQWPLYKTNRCHSMGMVEEGCVDILTPLWMNTKRLWVRSEVGVRVELRSEDGGKELQSEEWGWSEGAPEWGVRVEWRRSRGRSEGGVKELQREEWGWSEGAPEGGVRVEWRSSRGRSKGGVKELQSEEWGWSGGVRVKGGWNEDWG